MSLSETKDEAFQLFKFYNTKFNTQHSCLLIYLTFFHNIPK